MMYSDTITVLSLFYQIYDIESIENKRYYFVNLNMAYVII